MLLQRVMLPFFADIFIIVVVGAEDAMKEHVACDASLSISVLLTIIMRCLSLHRFCMSLSSSGVGIPSMTHRTTIALFIVDNARLMPMRSMVSSVFLSPAVSMKRKSSPLMVVVSSMMSLVVPCTSETIALSSCSKALSSVDFPTFVFPTIATGIPFFTAFPVLKLSARLMMWLSISCAKVSSSLLSANSSSSWSEKSSSSSRSDVSLSSFFLSSPSLELKCPFSWLMASWCCARLVAAMMSATASACARSIFPLRYALRVYSPGSA